MASVPPLFATLLLADARLPSGGHAQSAGVEPALLAGLDPAEAFAALRRHSAFRGAVARGAVVVEMPRLDPPELALEVERKRLGFGAARDGEGALGPLDRAGVRAWMDRMERTFARVEPWLP